MKQKNYYLLLLLIIFGTINSCQRQQVGQCSETFYRIQNIQISSLIHKNGASFYETYWNPYNMNDSVASSDTLGVRLSFAPYFYADNVIDRWKQFSIFPTANALVIVNCPGGAKGSKEAISKIYITSDADIDAQHLKNQSLNDLFFMMDNVSGNFDVPFNEYLKQIYSEGKNIPFQNSIFNAPITLLLKKRPAAGSTHTFTFWVEDNKGQKNSINTSAILFL